MSLNESLNKSKSSTESKESLNESKDSLNESKCLCTKEYNDTTNRAFFCENCSLTRCEHCWNESGSTVCPECYHSTSDIIVNYTAKTDECTICYTKMYGYGKIYNCGHSCCNDCFDSLLKSTYKYSHLLHVPQNVQPHPLYTPREAQTPPCFVCRHKVTKHFKLKDNVFYCKTLEERKIWTWNLYNVFSNLSNQIPKPTLVEAIREYKKFMILKFIVSDTDAVILSPPPVVDVIWHAHILFTKDYTNFCKDCIKDFIHHNPGGAYENIERQKRINTTTTEYIKRFGYGNNADCWLYTPISQTPATAPNAFVLTVKMMENSSIDITTNPEMYIWEIASIIQDISGICANDLRFIHAGKQLDQTKQLLDYNITSKTFIHCILRLSGC